MNDAWIVAAGAVIFGWLLYRDRIPLIEWVAVEALAIRDAMLARRSARLYWRCQLKDARTAKLMRMEGGH